MGNKRREDDMSRDQRNVQHARWIVDLVKRFQTERKFGSLIINFNDGVVVNVKEEVSKKPPIS